MANTFKNYAVANVGTSASTVISASTATTIIGLTIANKLTSAITASILLNTGGSDYYVLKDATILPGGTLVPSGMDQKIVLENGDLIKVVCSASNAADVIASVLEIS